jgi:aminopeptidase YwaD
MKKIFSTLFLCFLIHLLFSQEIKKGNVYHYARKIVDTMTSESMHGRGYVNDGDRIAANYIKTEFQKFGLRSFTKDYYQKISFSVNTFPKEMSVKIDGKELVPGKDYIVGESSGSAKETYTLKRYFANKDSAIEIPGTDTKNAAIINGVKNPVFNLSNAPIIYLEKDKLTQDIAQNQVKALSIHLLKDALPESAKEISFDIKNKFIKKHPSQNIIAYVEGSVHPDSFIVFSAHYDHLGQMGKDVYFPGANDNASGCAMLLNLANYYSKPEHKPTYSIAFIAFCGEELGLLGSKYYTEHPLFPMKNIRFLLNMDIMGTGEEGITVVNGTLFKSEFNKLKEINSQNDFIKDVKIRGKAANSDHYFFSEKGVRSFFIYTMGGIKAYHDIYDKAETLPLNEFEDLFKLIITFGDYLQSN